MSQNFAQEIVQIQKQLAIEEKKREANKLSQQIINFNGLYGDVCYQIKKNKKNDLVAFKIMSLWGEEVKIMVLKKIIEDFSNDAIIYTLYRNNDTQHAIYEAIIIPKNINEFPSRNFETPTKFILDFRNKMNPALIMNIKDVDRLFN